MKNHKDLFIEIGARIKTARENAGFTQEKLANIIGVSTQFISDVERGVSGPSVFTIISICRILHVSSDYILMGIMENSLDNSPFKGLIYMTDEEQQALIKSVRRLNEALAYSDSQELLPQ